MEAPVRYGNGGRGYLVRTLLLVMIGMLAIAADAHAQRGTRHAVGAEYAGMVLYGSTSLQYELITSDRLSFRFGFGSSYATIIVADIEAVGGTAMVNFMTRGAHKFEAGVGLSLLRSNFSLLFDDARYPLAYRVYPALSVAYRTMPRGRGVFWRVGAAWMYGYGLPLLIGAGYVF